MANLAEKDYGSDPIMWADYRTPSSEYTGRSLGLKGIAEGYVDDPSVTQMSGMLGAAGRQQLGAARSADMASGAARGRLGRGAQQQTQLMAPGMLDALRAQTQQAAQQQELGRVGYQRGQRQSQMEARRNAEMAAVLGQESALAKGEAADTAGMASGAVQGAGAGAAFGPWGALAGGLIGGTIGYFAEEGGVVPGNKDEAVPVIAHGGELILSEDASKKLLKALADKDKGTLQAFERDILENKGVLQSFERDAPQRDPAKPFSPAELDAIRAPLIESPEHQHRMAMRAAENRVAMQPTIRPFDRGRRKVEGDEWMALPQGSDPDEYRYGNRATGRMLRTHIPPDYVEIEKSGRVNDLRRQNMPYMLRGSTQQPPRLGDLPHGPAMPQPQYDALSDLDKRLSKDDEIIRQAVESVRGAR